MTWEDAVVWLRKQPDKVDLVRACFYDDPIEEAASRYRNSAEWEATRALLSGRAGAALDIGAGRGIASFALAADGWQTVALEPDPSAIVGAAAIRRLAASTELPIEVIEDVGENLPFPADTFDLVYGRAVMHHARSLAGFCGEAARVLRRGGLFIGAREHVVSSNRQLADFLVSHPLHSHYGGEHAYPLREYLRAIRNAGLTLRRVLHPWASDINLHPSTRTEVRARIAKRLRLPSPILVPWVLVDAAGMLRRDPGRLYTFVAEKE